MGAYLIYKLEISREAIKANNFLELQEEQKELRKSHNSLWFWDSRDRAIELKKLKETGCGCPDYKKIGEGDFKASGVGFEDENQYNRVFQLVTELFRKLHNQFKIKVYSGSCALSLDYFTKEQIKIITKNGDALSGKYKDEIIGIISEKPIIMEV